MQKTIKKDGIKNFGKSSEYMGQKAKNLGGEASAAGETGFSTYLEEELSMCARFVNKKCKDIDRLNDRLPMNPDSDDLFHVMSDGLVLIYLLNMIEEDLIDMRTVCLKPQPNIY